MPNGLPKQSRASAPALAVSALMLLILAAQPARADVSESHDDQDARGPYCGVYCLRVAAALCGKEIKLDSLILPRYIGSPQGSSLGELQFAARDLGVHAQAMTGLTTNDLRRSSDPMILHVISELGTEYDHWVLFMDISGGNARIYDPPGDERLLPFAELAARWDGSGLIVSSSPVRTAAFASGRSAATGVVALAVLVAYTWRRARQPAKGSRRQESATSSRIADFLPSIRQAGGIFTVATALGCGWNVFADEGLLRPSAGEPIIRAQMGKLLPKLSKEQVQRHLAEGSATVIDARYARDFQSGHIPGAVAVPVTTTASEISQRMQGVPKHRFVILYCQSNGCPFSQQVALKAALRRIP